MITYMKLRLWCPPLLLSLVCALLFMGLASAVHSHPSLSIDHHILVWIDQRGGSALDLFFRVITTLGEPTAVAGFVVVLALWLYRKGRTTQAILALFAILGSVVLMVALKHYFHRVRPDLWQPLVHELSFSFPSAHAMASITLALLGAYVLWGHPWRKTMLACMAGYVVVIGISRLYLGVHYPSDILGGWLVAAAWVLLVISIHSGSKRYTV